MEAVTARERGVPQCVIQNNMTPFAHTAIVVVSTDNPSYIYLTHRTLIVWYFSKAWTLPQSNSTSQASIW